MKKLLKDKNCLLFISGVFLSRIGDAFSCMALLLILLNLTGSNTYVSLLMLAHYIPGTIIGFTVGPIIDHLPKKIILICCYLFSAINMLFILHFMHDPSAILILAFIMGISYGIFMPCQKAYVAELIPMEHIKHANVLVQWSEVSAFIVGFTVVGIVIQFEGFELAFILDSISYIAIAILMSFTKRIRKPNPEDREPLIKTLKESVPWFFSRRALWLPAVCFSFAWVSTGTLYALEVNYARTYLGASDFMIGILFSLSALGSVLGIFYVAKFKYGERMRVLYIAILCEMILVMFYGLSNSISIAFMFIFSYGACLAIRQISITTAYHKMLPHKFHGRAFANQQALTNVGMFVGMGLSGPLSQFFSMREVIVGACILSLISVSALLIFNRIVPAKTVHPSTS